MDEIEEFAVEQGLNWADIINIDYLVIKLIEQKCPSECKKAIKEVTDFYREFDKEHPTWESLSEERKEELARKYPNIIAILVASKLENSD